LKAPAFGGGGGLGLTGSFLRAAAIGEVLKGEFLEGEAGLGDEGVFRDVLKDIVASMFYSDNMIQFKRSTRKVRCFGECSCLLCNATIAVAQIQPARVDLRLA